MVFEDTIETQMGATLFAFFNTFLLFVQKENSTEQPFSQKVVNSPSRNIAYE